MRSFQVFIFLLMLVALPVTGYPQPTCDDALMLSDQQVKDIIDKERATRKDLPPPFPKYRWVVERQGCYYVYFEYGIPEAMHYEQIFKLNRHGAIVDVLTGGS